MKKKWIDRKQTDHIIFDECLRGSFSLFWSSILLAHSTVNCQDTWTEWPCYVVKSLKYVICTGVITAWRQLKQQLHHIQRALLNVVKHGALHGYSCSSGFIFIDLSIYLFLYIRRFHRRIIHRSKGVMANNYWKKEERNTTYKG